jgi:hypothetical protein
MSFLPPELWLTILRWATRPDDEDSCTSYHPFQRPAQLILGLHDSDSIVKFKLGLMSVCRLWYSLLQNALYEDIGVGRDLVEILNTNLLKPSEQNDIIDRRSLVRRLRISYSATATETPAPLFCLDTIRLCSNLEVLSRPIVGNSVEMPRFEFDAPECPPLRTLKRIDWWHDNEANRSGGINSLYNVLRNAPNVEYLSLGGFPWLNFCPNRQAHITLPALRTLCVHKMNMRLLHHLCLWNLPQLSHIVVVIPSEGSSILSNLWSQFGPQLTTVELGCSMRFLMEDYVTSILRSCEKLETLNYHVYFTLPSVATDSFTHTSVTTVGLHAQPNLSLSRDKSIRLIQQHMDFLVGPMLPRLHLIVLYGRWDAAVLGGMKTYLPSLRSRGCNIVYADGLPVEFI